MADGGGHGEGGPSGGGLYDPFLMPDYLDDVLYLLDLPGGGDGVDPPPPPAAALPLVQNATTAGPCGPGDTIMELPAIMDDNYDVDGSRHTLNANNAADLPAGALDMGAGTSGTSSSAARQDNATLDCTGCQVLREVVHSNGLEATKLCIHGAAGVFHHATLQVYRISAEGLVLALTDQSCVDFRGRDYAWVKRYLAGYARRRAGGGYAVVHDSVSAFHDALCTGMVSHRGHADDDDRGEGEIMMAAAAEAAGNGDSADQQVVTVLAGGAGDDAAQAAGAALVEPGSVPEAPAGPSEPRNDLQEQQQEVRRTAARSALSIQRERARDLELRDIARVFHLPIVEAAKQLGVCATVLKGTSRRFHIPRWPHRKIKSIDTRIAKLRRGGNGDAVAMREIERLMDSRRKIYDGLG